MIMKVCSRCKHERPLSDYNKFSRAPDGLSYWCRKCRNAWEIENKEKRLARQKTAEYRAKRTEWRKRVDQTAKTREYHKQWYQQNKARVRAKMDQWRAENLDVWNSYSRKQRATKKSAATEPYTLSEIYERDSGICGICGGGVSKLLKFPDRRSASLDHIKPLNKGGTDLKINIQLAHLGCNAAKRDSYVEEA